MRPCQGHFQTPQAHWMPVGKGRKRQGRRKQQNVPVLVAAETRKWGHELYSQGATGLGISTYFLTGTGAPSRGSWGLEGGEPTLVTLEAS